jgi:hypothetical protein
VCEARLKADQHERDQAENDDLGRACRQHHQHDDGPEQSGPIAMCGSQTRQPRGEQADRHRRDERSASRVRADVRRDEEVEDERNEDRRRVEHWPHPRAGPEAHERSSR